MPFISDPDVRLLWEVQQLVRSRYAYEKLQRAIEHLEMVHEQEQNAEDEHATLLYIDTKETHA